MKPDRTNYEIWFIDLMDGKLTCREIDEFRHFLDKNPDLKEEAEALEMVYLEPGEMQFTGKEKIKKTTAGYSSGQFEDLCIASLENDLTSDQAVELQEIISTDEQRKKTFELISKLKLKPTPGTFKKKSSIKRITLAGKVIRIAVTGLSVAAAAILLLLVVKPGTGSTNVIGESENKQAADTLLIRTPVPLFRPELLASAQPVADIPEKSRVGLAPAVETEEQVMAAFTSTPSAVDASARSVRAEAVNAIHVPVHGDVMPDHGRPAPQLMGFNPLNISPFPFYDDGRSNVERFLARIFHERIMNDTISAERPVERFELAEAGLAGLNRLFGWELALQRNTDEKGELKSYYFSSKLLKFNAPVKKATREL